MRGWFSREYEPVETVEPGGSVSFQVPNAGWFWDADVEPERPEGAGHALHGPVEVHGAREGQTLVVRIDEVVPRDWGRTWADGETFAWSRDGDWWQLGERRVRSAPFLGVIGMPPPEPGEHSTTPPRRWGGNIDCKELVAGSTLYLPIAVDGALFSTGDGHAAQGDGEVSGTAIECPMERVELTFALHDDMPLTTPIAQTPAGWVAMGFDADLDEATLIALETMVDLVAAREGVRRADALALCSVAVDLRVTQIVNQVCGVHAVLAPDALVSSS